MKISIPLYCPRCRSESIKKNGKKSYCKTNYRCKECGRQFIGDHNLTNKGCHSEADSQIQLMVTRRCGIRDICAITGYSRGKVQAAIARSKCVHKPKKHYYSELEIDEFHTFIGNKKNKVWLQYAYERESGEIVAFVWGKRDLETALALKAELKRLNITYGRVVTDLWESFAKAFSDCEHVKGKAFTVGIEGNNCRLRHRCARAIRRSCCFSKREFYHFKVFDLVFQYVNKCNEKRLKNRQHTF